MEILATNLPTLAELQTREAIDVAGLVQKRIQQKTLKSLVENISKEIQGLDKTIVKALAALSVGRHVLFLGPVGSGKTTLAVTLAQELNLSNDGVPYMRVDSHPDITASDLVGDIDIAAAKTFGLEHPLAVIHGPALLGHGKILIIDEINRMTPQAQASLLQILQEGKTFIRGFPIITSTLVIATANPTEFLGTFEMSEALKDRMMVIPVDIPDVEVLKSILKVKGMRVSGKEIPEDFIKITAYLISTLHADKEIFIGPSIRSGIYSLSTAIAMADMEEKEPSLEYLESALIDNFSSIVEGDFENEQQKRAYIQKVFRDSLSKLR